MELRVDEAFEDDIIEEELSDQDPGRGGQQITTTFLGIVKKWYLTNKERGPLS